MIRKVLKYIRELKTPKVELKIEMGEIKRFFTKASNKAQPEKK